MSSTAKISTTNWVLWQRRTALLWARARRTLNNTGTRNSKKWCPATMISEGEWREATTLKQSNFEFALTYGREDADDDEDERNARQQ